MRKAAANVIPVALANVRKSLKQKPEKYLAGVPVLLLKKIVILTDSLANIPAYFHRQLNLVVMPPCLLWGGASLWDGVDIHPDAFYDRLRCSQTLQTSSQPITQEFETTFKR